MILTLAWRSLVSRPVRSAVLAGGFGLGVSVMAALLGIGAVILDQARAPELSGGGDVVIGGTSGRLSSARFVLTTIVGAEPLAASVIAAAPSKRASLYLVDDNGTTPIRARGSIPSRDRALNDRETADVRSWTDTAADREWAAPDADMILREMDRFHPIPAVPERARSWAEWLYFNGQSGTTRFYLTFLAGPRLESGRRRVGVRLQLERGGRLASYADSADVDETELLKTAPELTIAKSRVGVSRGAYLITLNLPEESGGSRITGDMVVQATPGRSFPPFAIRGAGGWISGYVVPVTSGALRGTLHAGQETIDLDGGTGYHDHNWGFWEGVSWQWGQVQGGGLSFVYGRVRPPADAADPERIPGFLAALGPEGPVGYATDVTIEETNEPGTNKPARIVVRSRSQSLTVALDAAIDQTVVTRMRAGAFGSGLDFLQMRAQYRVTGRVIDKSIDFTASGSAETFRGR